jgi:hypothetical protein
VLPEHHFHPELLLTPTSPVVVEEDGLTTEEGLMTTSTPARAAEIIAWRHADPLTDVPAGPPCVLGSVIVECG